MKNEQCMGFLNKAGHVYLYASLNRPLPVRMKASEHIIAEVG